MPSIAFAFVSLRPLQPNISLCVRVMRSKHHSRSSTDQLIDRSASATFAISSFVV